MGDVGCDGSPGWKTGSMDGSRSMSRTGRMKPSTASMVGTALARGWITCRDGDTILGRLSCL